MGYSLAIVLWAGILCMKVLNSIYLSGYLFVGDLLEFADILQFIVYSFVNGCFAWDHVIVTVP